MSATGLSGFVVEDEPMIRIVVADMLGVLGHTIAAEAGNVDAALRLAPSTEFDLALLDVNLQGKMITPVAEHFRNRLWSGRLAGRISRSPLSSKAVRVGSLAKAIDEMFRSRYP
jgi:CheY-like chemotaxis protein